MAHDPMPMNQALETLRIIVAQQKALKDLELVLDAAAQAEGLSVAASRRKDELDAACAEAETRLQALKDAAEQERLDHAANLRAHEAETAAIAAENKKLRAGEAAKTRKRLAELKEQVETAERDTAEQLAELARQRGEAEERTAAAQAALDAIRAKVAA